MSEQFEANKSPIDIANNVASPGQCRRNGDNDISPVHGRYVGFTLMWERSTCGFHVGAQRAGFIRGTKEAITNKIKHAIKLKTFKSCMTYTPVAQLLQPSLAFWFSLQPMTAYRPVLDGTPLLAAS